MASQHLNLWPMIRLDAMRMTGGMLRTYAFIAIIAVGFSFFSGPFLIGAMVSLASYTAALSLMQTDEVLKATNLYGTLPVSRRSVIAVGGVTLLLCLQWPLTLRFGSRKTTLIATVIVFGTVGVAVGVGASMDLTWLSPYSWWIGAAALGLLAIAVPSSYAASVRIFERQDH